jgi:virulence factor Mce-like protein
MNVSTARPPGPLTRFTRWRLGVKTYGLVFLLVVGILVGLAVAAYQKVFTPVAMVSLETSRLGNQLQQGSDVKIRGLIVGEVRDIALTPTGTRLGLALQPDRIDLIPANVRARILPKTLFGERYVDLVTVAAPAPAIRAGDVITADRSSVAIELETVLDNLEPLLTTVRPATLATTLNAMATTLDGRGEQLGANLERLGGYLKAINPKLPVIQADTKMLATTLGTYADLTPDLLRLTEALRTTNRTIVEKDQQLAAFFVSTAGLAGEAAGFLRDNEERIIRVGRVSRPTLELLARYAPIYPCVAEGLVGWLPRVNEAFSQGAFHITLEVVPPRQAYGSDEAPRWGEKSGPNCYSLPKPSHSQANPGKGHHFDDGTRPADSGSSGTAQEQALVGALLARDGGGEPSSIQTLLAGPLLRGTVVSTR